MRLINFPFLTQGFTVDQESIDQAGELIEPWFIFALIWSVGATCDENGRKKFSEYLRQRMVDGKVSFVGWTGQRRMYNPVEHGAFS